jgi:hypothetical protein
MSLDCVPPAACRGGGERTSATLGIRLLCDEDYGLGRYHLISDT